MNRIARILFVTLLVYGIVPAQVVRLSTAYNVPLLSPTHSDSVLNGLNSIRGCAFDPNPEKDGKSEIALTNYNDNGHVSVFQTVGNDSIRLVWTSPTLTPGGNSTPRSVVFGDLDNDGKKEIIFELSGVGILIFEHDGVPGSHNYGTKPSQIITTPDLVGIASSFSEYMETLDVDGDGQNELVIAINSTPNSADCYYVISGVGDWSTNDPGFSGFNVEFLGVRTNLTNYGMNGTPYAMISGNLDGSGKKTILLHAFNLKSITPVRVPSANTYLLADTTRHKQSIALGGTFDEVALMGGMAYDIDKDGREEIYLPTYPAAGSPNAGKVHMITYDAGQSTSEIDSTNVTALDLSSVLGTKAIFGYGYGDIDRNGKPNLYFTTTNPTDVVTLEFQGGNKKLQSNWKASVLYAGDASICDSLVIKDSLGKVDTTKYPTVVFPSKIYARNTDFDKDGFEDILLPYQAYADSVLIRRMTWNAGSSSFTQTVTKIVNTKRWGFRILEATVATGIEAKDLTVIMPDDFKLEQNYPNPFNPSTTIRFRLPVKERITLKVFDILGKEVRTLIDNQELPAGSGEAVWDGKSNSGQAVASGTYFYKMIYGNFQKSEKMVLLK